MPFRSNSQRKYLFAKHPAIAKEFAKATPKGAKLPEHVKKSAADVVGAATKNRKKKKPAEGLGWAPYALAGGAGVYGLGKLVASDEDLARADKFVEASKGIQAEKDPTKLMQQYSDASADIIKARPFHLDPVKTVELVRKGISTFSKDPGWKWDENSSSHYDAFKKGPLQGYLKLIDEVDFNKDKPIGFDVDETKKEISGHIAEKSKELGTTPDKLTTEQQSAILKGLAGDPALAGKIRAMDSLMVLNYRGANAGYSRLTKGITTGARALQWGGLAAAGIGAAGILYRILSRKSKDEE